MQKKNIVKEEHKNKQILLKNWLKCSYDIRHPKEASLFSIAEDCTSSELLENEPVIDSEMLKQPNLTDCNEKIHIFSWDIQEQKKKSLKIPGFKCKTGNKTDSNQTVKSGYFSVSDSLIWEPMDILNGGYKNWEISDKRSQSVPPENRVHHSKTFTQQQKAKKHAKELYKSKDDLHQTKLLCFPINCCTTPKHEFYSRNNNYNIKDVIPYTDGNTVCQSNINTKHHETLQDKDVRAIPNIIPDWDTSMTYTNYHSVGKDGTSLKLIQHDPVMPDLLLSSTNIPHDRKSRSQNKLGTVRNQYGSETVTLDTKQNLFRYGEIPQSTAEQHSPFNFTIQGQRAQPEIDHYYSVGDYQNFDTTSNDGTTYTLYDIESSPHSKSTTMKNIKAIMCSSISKSSITAAATGSIVSRQNSRITVTLGVLGRCLMKFGKKSPPSVKLPGQFSYPKRVDIMPHGTECVILDTENQTLQLFTIASGVCTKVYQYQYNVIDMKVWNSQTLALLYQNRIGLFDMQGFKVTSVIIQRAQNPRVLEKMTDRITGKNYFVVAMCTEVIIYDELGNIINVIGELDHEQNNKLFHRIKSLCIDSNNNIYVLDGMLKVIYRFSSSGKLRAMLDTKVLHTGPVSNPFGMCIDPNGTLLIADTFNHRILVVQMSSHCGRCIQEFCPDYFPNDIKITHDGKLIVAINSEYRTFAGIRLYNYKHIYS